MEILLPWCPVATDDTIMGDDGEENAIVGMGMMDMSWGQGELSALITYQVFIEGRQKMGDALAEAPGSA